LQVDLEVELAALVGGDPTGHGAQRGDQRQEDRQRLLEGLAVDESILPKFARFAASTGKDGRMPREVWFAASAAPETVCSVVRSCGSALLIPGEPDVAVGQRLDGFQPALRNFLSSAWRRIPARDPGQQRTHAASH
jgi:hypothetical protein